MRSMPICAAAATLVVVLLGPPAGAQMRLLEQAIESSTFELSLPEGGGTLIARACDECKTLVLRITAQTVSFVDGQPVDYAELYRLSRQARADLAVFYDPDTNEVTRLKLVR